MNFAVGLELSEQEVTARLTVAAEADERRAALARANDFIVIFKISSLNMSRK
jgi:hypothetical protein